MVPASQIREISEKLAIVAKRNRARTGRQSGQRILKSSRRSLKARHPGYRGFFGCRHGDLQGFHMEWPN